MVNGIVDNFQKTINLDNFINYLTTDDYGEIVDYTKSAMQTAGTVYGGYKLGKALYNKASTVISNYQTDKIMSSVKIANVNIDKLSQIRNNYSLTNSPYNGIAMNFASSGFDLKDPNTFKGQKLNNIEKYLDKQLRDNQGYKKGPLKDGNGIRYTKGRRSYQLNYGYEPIQGGTIVHTGPYFKTTVGSTIVRIPLE